MAPISQNNGVTPKTDRQANRLVKKRKKVRKKIQKVTSKDKKTKLGKYLKKKRIKRLTKKEARIQEKINKNPTAQSWRNKGKKAQPVRYEDTNEGSHRIGKSLPQDNTTDNIPKEEKRKHDRLRKGRGHRRGKKIKKLGGFRTMGATWIEPGAASLDD